VDILPHELGEGLLIRLLAEPSQFVPVTCHVLSTLKHPTSSESDTFFPCWAEAYSRTANLTFVVVFQALVMERLFLLDFGSPGR
jgi:hypothetical protein